MKGGLNCISVFLPWENIWKKSFLFFFLFTNDFNAKVMPYSLFEHTKQNKANELFFSISQSKECHTITPGICCIFKTIMSINTNSMHISYCLGIFIWKVTSRKIAHYFAFGIASFSFSWNQLTQSQHMCMIFSVGSKTVPEIHTIATHKQ